MVTNISHIPLIPNKPIKPRAYAIYNINIEKEEAPLCIILGSTKREAIKKYIELKKIKKTNPYYRECIKSIKNNLSVERIPVA